MTKLYKAFIPLAIILFLNACNEETEILEHPLEVNNDEGIMIKPDNTFEILENTEIISATVTDSIQYNNIKLPTFSIEVVGEETERIKKGTIIIDHRGLGDYYMVTEIIGRNKVAGSTQALRLKSFKPTLDFLFNYDGALLEFSSPTNRAKRNLNIDGKIYNNPTDDDSDKFKVENVGENENWNGFDYNKTRNGINLNFNETKIELKGKKGTKFENVSLGCEFQGYLRINPSLDFSMEYNPMYFKRNDNQIISLFQTMGDINPVTFFNKSALTLGTLKHIKAITYTELDYGIDVELDIKASLLNREQGEFKKKLFKTTQVYPAGVVPVAHDIILELVVDVQAQGELDANYSYHRENDIVAGFNHTRFPTKKTTWYKISDSRKIQNSSLVAEIELSAGVKLRLTNKIYIAKVLGPKIESWGYVEGEASFWNSSATGYGWNIGLKAGIDAKASLDLSAFGIDAATWEIIVSENWNLWGPVDLYKSPWEVRVTDGQGQIGQKNEMLLNPIKVEVLDNLGNKIPDMPVLKVPVFFEGSKVSGFNGSPNPVKAYTENGEAVTQWTLDDYIGTQYLHVTLKDEKGNNFGESTTISATTGQPTVEEAFDFLADYTEGKRYNAPDASDVPDMIIQIINDNAQVGTDLVFLIDNTASMDNDITEVKKAITNIINILPSNTRLGAATYNDANDHPSNWYSWKDLTLDHSEITSYVNNIKTRSNWDTPESVFHGIYNTVDYMNWNLPKRMIIVIGDAPPLVGNDTKYSASDVIEKCKEEGILINLYPILIGNTTKSAETNGNY